MCCERKVWRNDGEVGIRWDVLVWGRVGLAGGAVRRYRGRGVCYGHGASGRGVWTVDDVKLSEAEQGDQKEEDMVVSERPLVVGA